jgi:hypothetical protein
VGNVVVRDADDGDALRTNLALTASSPWSSRVQWATVTARHAPSQPFKAKPRAGRAVSVTLANVAEQVSGQLMPRGLLVTAPRPWTLTVSV